MKPVKVAAAVLNQIPLDWEGNMRRMLAAIEEARRQGCQLLCLPELCITGYGCQDAFLSSSLWESAQAALLEVAEECQEMVVAVGLPLWHGGSLYNAAALIVDGAVAGLVGKQNLAGEGIHYESRWFAPWPAGMVSRTTLAGIDVPIGDLVFELSGFRIGFEICRDAWVASRPGTDLTRHAVDLILNPSASHFAFGKHATRQRFVLEGSRAFHVGYVYTNLLGNESGRAIYDGDAMIASNGKMLAECRRFSFADYRVISAVFDIEEARMLRAQWGGGRPDAGEDGRVVRLPFRFEEAPWQPVATPAGGWEESEHLEFEEFTRAVALGLFDYLRKSRAEGFVVSLSGGADSTATSLLCRIAVELALAELGPEGLAQRLAHLHDLPSSADPAAWTRRLLTCLYQATANSSATTRHAAKTVAEELGAEFFELDVESLVQGYIDAAQSAIGRSLTWDQDDAALQNIQARARAPMAWLFANLHRAILLCTSNRSEAAVGYATMDGDTAGGLCPIGGIDKSFLRRWLRWLELHGYSGGPPRTFLEVVTQQAPTAELRPPEAEQTDEGDLMPYDVLADIERAAIRDRRSPKEVYWEILPVWGDQYAHDQLRRWIRRFFQLWARSQWKRERLAPSFHVDDHNLDPKTWCRFPILSGGFEKELRELDAIEDSRHEEKGNSVAE